MSAPLCLEKPPGRRRHLPPQPRPLKKGALRRPWALPPAEAGPQRRRSGPGHPALLRRAAPPAGGWAACPAPPFSRGEGPGTPQPGPPFPQGARHAHRAFAARTFVTRIAPVTRTAPLSRASRPSRAPHLCRTHRACPAHRACHAHRTFAARTAPLPHAPRLSCARSKSPVSKKRSQAGWPETFEATERRKPKRACGPCPLFRSERFRPPVQRACRWNPCPH